MSRVYFYGKQILFYLVVIVYILLMAKILLFKYVSPLELFNAERMVTRNFNLIPFQTISQYSFGAHFNIWITLMNVAGNVIVFVPLGIYMQMFLRNKRFLRSVAFVCVISLCVEAVQYIFGIGAADIDDIILNTIGGLLGVLFYKIVYMVLKDENKTKTVITFLFYLAGLSFFCFIQYLQLSGFAVRLF